MTREGSLSDDTGDGRVDQEVLSSHPRTAVARGRAQTWVVAMALTTMLAVSLAVHGMAGPDQPATSGTNGHARSYAGSSASLDLVALIRNRCPHARRLRLGDVDTLRSVEIAPCSTGGHRGRDARCRRDAVSIRFDRIVGARPGTGGQHSRWIEVRRTAGACQLQGSLLGD